MEVTVQALPDFWRGKPGPKKGVKVGRAGKIRTSCGHVVAISKVDAGGERQCMVVISGPTIRNNSGIRSFYSEPTFEIMKSKLEEHVLIDLDHGSNEEAGTRMQQRIQELWPADGAWDLDRLTEVMGSSIVAAGDLGEAVTEVKSPTMAIAKTVGTREGCMNGTREGCMNGTRVGVRRGERERERNSLFDDDDGADAWHASFDDRPRSVPLKGVLDPEAVKFDDLWHHGAPDKKGTMRGDLQREADKRRAWQLKLPASSKGAQAAKSQAAKDALPQLR
jgi:hypothetical protein